MLRHVVRQQKVVNTIYLVEAATYLFSYGSIQFRRSLKTARLYGVAGLLRSHISMANVHKLSHMSSPIWGGGGGGGGSN